MATHVNYCLCLDDEEGLQLLKKELNGRFDFKVEHELDNYLVCNIVRNRGGKALWTHQHHHLKKIEVAFCDKVSDKNASGVPSTPLSGPLRLANDKAKTDTKSQDDYRSGVCKLFYMVKHC